MIIKNFKMSILFLRKSAKIFAFGGRKPFLKNKVSGVPYIGEGLFEKSPSPSPTSKTL
jgi:hypothetical protein